MNQIISLPLSASKLPHIPSINYRYYVKGRVNPVADAGSNLKADSHSLMHLLSLVQVFEKRGIEIVSLREHIDSSTATGRAFLSILGATNQMDRELKSERAAAGRASAKARGRTDGRPRTDVDKLEKARVLYKNSDVSAANVCATLGVGRRTFINYQAEKRDL